MRKEVYQVPTMRIVKLQHRSHILTGSPANASVQDYTMHDETEEVKANRNYDVWSDDWSKD